MKQQSLRSRPRFPGSAPLPWHRLLAGLERRVARTLMAIVAASAVASCTGPKTELGIAPAIDRLAELRAGVSTRDDVLRALGQPNGEGAARIPDFPGYRTLWPYQIVATDGFSTEYTILLVFFDGNIFDGYLWFDNAHEIEVL